MQLLKPGKDDTHDILWYNYIDNSGPYNVSYIDNVILILMYSPVQSDVKYMHLPPETAEKHCIQIK